MNITIKDIARLANVSSATVSRVLNNKPDVNPKTRKLILDIIKKYDYQPNVFAKAISSKKSNTIGLVIPHETNFILENAFFDEVIRGITNELNNRGYYLLFCYTDCEKKVVKMYKERRVDGFIVLSPNNTHKKIINSLNNIEAPFVCTTRIIGEDSIVYADVDNHFGASLAVEHLISLGHRKIGFVRGNNVLTSSGERLRGYQDTLAKYGIAYDIDLMEVGDISIRGGYTAMENLLKRNKEMTAVFIACDVMAMGAIRAIKDKGMRIPEDISVVGFDGIPQAEFFDPPLTTVKQPSVEKGQVIADLLINELEEGKKSKPVLQDVELIIRKSTCRLK